jgi:hypothetical protein
MRAIAPLLLSLVAAAGCAMDGDPDVGAAVAAASLPPTPEENVGLLGVQTGRPLGDELNAFPLNGTTLARVNFVYFTGVDGNPATVAPDGSALPEYFDWFVRKHAEHGVGILPVLIKVAPYTVDLLQEIGARFVDDAEMPQWQQFARSLALRYGPGGTFWAENPDLTPQPIRAWEIWNEPNLETFWDASPAKTRPSPRRYRRILRAAHAGLRSADPRARVVLAGLAMPHGRPNVGWKPFLREVLDGNTPAERQRNRCLFDAVAIHPYSESVGGSVHNVERLYDFLEAERLTGRNRADDVQIWITEVGWSVPVANRWPSCRKTDAAGACIRWSSPLTVEDETQQAARLYAEMKALDRRRGRWRLGPTIWYTFEDLEGPVCSSANPKWWCFSGLWTTDEGGWRPRPAWHALGEAGGGRTVALPPVRCPAPNPASQAADDASDAAAEGGEGV